MKSLLLLSLLLLSLFNINSAQAQSITINASSAPYNLLPAITNANVNDVVDVRIAALSSAAGAFRSETGGFASPLKRGVKFKLTYKDGSSETGEMIGYSASVGAAPVPGTQRDANGNLIGSIGGGGDGSGIGSGGTGSSIGIIGYNPIYTTTWTCIGSDCTLNSTLIGYEPIYGPVYEFRPQ